MVWSNYQEYLVTGDKKGYIFYYNQIINPENKFIAHNECCIRDLAFSLSSVKFVSSSDDRTAKIWDFATSKLLNTFTEHNSDVACCDWHPF